MAFCSLLYIGKEIFLVFVYKKTGSDFFCVFNRVFMACFVLFLEKGGGGIYGLGYYLYSKKEI